MTGHRLERVWTLSDKVWGTVVSPPLSYRQMIGQTSADLRPTHRWHTLSMNEAQNHASKIRTDITYDTPN